MEIPIAPTGGNQRALTRHMRLRSATALVIANMIGAGIFTTTGFQAADLRHPLFIFVLWVIGGTLALLGALCYAELGAMMPRAGAEYVYLRETYGPAIGFMSAFVSLVAGFSAPIAAALKSFVIYLAHFFPFLADDPTVGGVVAVIDLIAVGLVWILVAIHVRAVRSGTGFNDFITAFKVGGIVLIILAAVSIGRGDASNLITVSPSFQELSRTDTLAAFGTSLIFVMFCFSGWNAAAYVASEMEHPQRDLPRALLLGTATVLLLYLGLNAVYFYGASVDQLAGQVEVGLVASRSLFGPTGVSMVTIVLCASILASASAMTLVGAAGLLRARQGLQAVRLPRPDPEDRRSCGGAPHSGDRDFCHHPLGTRRPDPAVRRFHAHALREPRRLLRDRFTPPQSGTRTAVPGLGLSDQSYPFSYSIGVDDVLGLPGAPGRIRPFSADGPGRWYHLRGLRASRKFRHAVDRPARV